MLIATEEDNQAYGTNYNNVMEVRQEWFWPPSPPTDNRHQWDMSNKGGTCNPNKSKSRCPAQGPKGKYEGPLCSVLYETMEPVTQPWGHVSGDYPLSEMPNPMCPSSSKCMCPAANIWTLPLFVSYGQNRHYRNEMQVSVTEGNYLLLKAEGEIPLKIPRSTAMGVTNTVVTGTVNTGNEMSTDNILKGQWTTLTNSEHLQRASIHKHHHKKLRQAPALDRTELAMHRSLLETATSTEASSELPTGDLASSQPYQSNVESADRQWKKYERTFSDIGSGTFDETGSLKPMQKRQMRGDRYPEAIQKFEMASAYADDGGDQWQAYGNQTYNNDVLQYDAKPIVIEVAESGPSTIADLNVVRNTWAGNIISGGALPWSQTVGDYTGAASSHMAENGAMDSGESHYRDGTAMTPSWDIIPEVTDYWFKMNAGFHVPMRVLYTPNNWNKLINMIDYSSGCDATRTCVAPLTAQDIAELIDDTQAFSLSEHTQLPNFVLPIMLNASHMHRGYPVWYTINDGMNYLGRTLRRVTGGMYSRGELSLAGKRNIATGFGVFSNCIFKDVGLGLAITGSAAATLDHSQMVLRELLVPSVLRADTRLAKRLWRENYGHIAAIDENVRITVLRVLMSSELDKVAAWDLQSTYMAQYHASDNFQVHDKTSNRQKISFASTTISVFFKEEVFFQNCLQSCDKQNFEDKLPLPPPCVTATNIFGGWHY